MMYNSAMSYAGDWKPKFLDKLEQTKSPRKSARLAGVPWSTVTSAKRRDKSFRRAWQAALAAPPKTDDAVTLTLPPELARILREQLNSGLEQN